MFRTDTMSECACIGHLQRLISQRYFVEFNEPGGLLPQIDIL